MQDFQHSLPDSTTVKVEAILSECAQDIAALADEAKELILAYREEVNTREVADLPQN